MHYIIYFIIWCSLPSGLFCRMSLFDFRTGLSTPLSSSPQKPFSKNR